MAIFGNRVLDGFSELDPQKLETSLQRGLQQPKRGVFCLNPQVSNSAERCMILKHAHVPPQCHIAEGISFADRRRSQKPCGLTWTVSICEQPFLRQYSRMSRGRTRNNPVDRKGPRKLE